MSELQRERDNNACDALSALDRLSVLISAGEWRQSVGGDKEATSSVTKQALGDVAFIQQKLNALVNRSDEARCEKSKIQVEMDALGTKVGKSPSHDRSESEWRVQLAELDLELSRTKEALMVVKADRKRLKTEKADLLSQMKRLYTTLEERDAELKEFISDYEDRMKEAEESKRHLVEEKESLEREKWDMLKRARDSAERSVALRQQLDTREDQIRSLGNQLERMKRGELPQDEEQLPPYSVISCDQSLTPSERAGSFNNQSSSSRAATCGQSRSPAHHPLSTASLISQQTVDEAALRSTVFATQSTYNRNSLSDEVERETPSPLPEQETPKKSKKKSSTFGSISRVFSRTKAKRSASADALEGLQDTSYGHPATVAIQCLTQDQLQERFRVLEESRGLPMARWKAATVVAWLEATMNMPQYADAFKENVKSGKVLIGLTDQELEQGLKMVKPMHRRKLRLAIAGHIHPGHVRFPHAGDLDHHWVANVWIHDLGLSLYAQAFHENLIDGRVLSTLDKKDMEKHLGISRKYYQASIIYGIKLLKMLQFDKQVLLERRAMSEEADTDPIVWTNSRLIKWVQSIDLEEYAMNLRNSGVHGAAIVLEPSFGAEAFATALGIPSSKAMVRKHLADELSNLITPARESIARLIIDEAVTSKQGRKKPAASLGRAVNRIEEERNKNKKRAFKGSLGRAFGRRGKDTNDSFMNDVGLELETTVV